MFWFKQLGLSLWVFMSLLLKKYTVGLSLVTEAVSNKRCRWWEPNSLEVICTDYICTCNCKSNCMSTEDTEAPKLYIYITILGYIILI